MGRAEHQHHRGAGCGVHRSEGAYLVGASAVAGGDALVIALVDGGRFVVADAVLVSEAEVSIVFSFTRSHFHVEAECPRELICSSSGSCRSSRWPSCTFRWDSTSTARPSCTASCISPDHDRRFVVAKGDPGLVMLVFTLPFYGLVFKVIRDRFAYPSETRARRCWTAIAWCPITIASAASSRLRNSSIWSFRGSVRTSCSPSCCGGRRSVASTGRVVLKHVYTERRVTPLNLYLRTATRQQGGMRS